MLAFFCVTNGPVIFVFTPWPDIVWHDIRNIDSVTKKDKNMARPLYEIAREIRKDWTKVSPYAAPYLSAMSTLNSVDDNYLYDSGYSIVCYFLANAGSWRGKTAKRIKAELKAMIK